ncbi:MAG: glycosyltransferase family 2 protein [Thermoplasmatales archaeon]
MQIENFKKPYISVIITAHNREKYLKEAIESVLNQTLNRSLYEIIVVKNFENQEIDELIRKNEIINLKSESNSLIGEDLALGIEKAKGEIICFLEDDDLFYPNKLEYVYNLFNNDKNLGYYKNNYFPINEQGEPTKFINKNKDFNPSSISIRKDIINIYYLRKVVILSDSFVYCSALESNYKILVNRLVFTKYRIHNSLTITLNLNFNDFLNKIKDNNGKYLETLHTFSEFFKSDRALKCIKSYIFDLESFNFILFGEKKPKNLFKNLFIFLFNSPKSKKGRIEIVLAYFAVSIFPKYFRTLIKKILYNRYIQSFK